MKTELNSLNLNEMEDFILDLGEKKFRAKQIFNFIHRQRIDKIDEITNLSKDFRNNLNDLAYIDKIEIYGRYESKIDNTKKYLFSLADNNIIESVAMEYKHGISVCISTQVGCNMGCSFCASTKGGLIRDLRVSEMLNQVYMIEKDLGREISNIVLMGSGEPLDNFENVVKFLEIISHEEARNISMRNITLSTCGIVPRIYELADLEYPITLAISLHSPFNDERKKIMPITNRYSIEDILEAIEYYSSKSNRRVTFEYTLIEGVNDGEKEARELVRLLKDLRAHVNLIPLNPIKEFKKEIPSNKSIQKFRDTLEKNGVNATIRREMGSDISASCGQLRRSVIEE